MVVTTELYFNTVEVQSFALTVERSFRLFSRSPGSLMHFHACLNFLASNVVLLLHVAATFFWQPCFHVVLLRQRSSSSVVLHCFVAATFF